MLIPAKMEIARIQFHSKRRRRIIRALHETGYLQLIDIQLQGQVQTDKEVSSQVSPLLAQVRRSRDYLGVKSTIVREKTLVDDRELASGLDYAQDLLNRIQPKIDEIREESTRLVERKASLEVQVEIADKLLPLGVDLDSIGEGPRFWVTVGSMLSDRVPRFRWNLNEALEGEYILSDVPSEKNTRVVLAGALLKHKDLLGHLLTSYGFTELKIPPELSGKPDDLQFTCHEEY